MFDINVVITNEEAIELFKKLGVKPYKPYTGKNEEGDPWTEARWLYDQLGCGRTSFGVKWEDVSIRAKKLLQKLLDRYKNNKFKPHGFLIFSSKKEVYPPVFLLILQ